MMEYMIADNRLELFTVNCTVKPKNLSKFLLNPFCFLPYYHEAVCLFVCLFFFFSLTGNFFR